MSLPLSCGTLIVNARRQLLLCHVTNTAKWDIPKGLLDAGETPLAAAMRELREEAGIAFDPSLFIEIGFFSYRQDKDLHLFKLRAPDDFDDLSQLHCSSFFADETTGLPTPEVDGYRWAGREQIRRLCWPRMATRLLALDW
ncbi:NUDIX domain-containing protein [Rugamonas sp.]|uniref:NUDIX hydrolase n=1 Tax=Rugamonas sp. TaxID=1926287 RepID=UPI0025D16A72|nr:NUDIX domain-containing protein [Rugamonas sp.]